MATHSKFDNTNSEFIVVNGQLVDGASLGANVAAKMNRSTGDLEAINVNETYDTTTDLGWHLNDSGYYWWSDPANQVFGTENAGGSGSWRIYKQTNIYTTARKYAGKDSLYGLHIFRYPNISSSSTWGGLILYPPASAKISGHTYRFSFDYRGQTGGANLDVYQNYEAGWGNLGVNLPGAWGRSLGAFDTDWEWRRYEQEFTISDELLNWIPGSNSEAWSANKTFSGGWRGITYNGYVYRLVAGKTTTLGVTPEDEYNSGNGVYNGKYPMTPGYFDIYRHIKIGFTYNTQGTRGTHVYVDNIQLTDITNNKRWKFNGTGWEADNLAEKTLHIKAKGTGHVSLNKGDGGDIFACEGNRVLEVNGNQIYNTSGRGLRLTVLDPNGNITEDAAGPRGGVYDTYGDDSHRTMLAERLSQMTDNDIWILTSYDAINPNSTLDAQMKSMGSVMHVNDGNIYSVFNGGGVRHPYAAVGRGQKLIKEDGANAVDNVYKRKGVIDLKL
jgi:hypothetical protein